MVLAKVDSGILLLYRLVGEGRFNHSLIEAYVEENEMTMSLAFDVYGTLIDTHGVVDALRDVVGDSAPQFSHQWREKQLEYSFRRGLMKDYVDFSVCTRQALNFTAVSRGQVLTECQSIELMQVYSRLPAFDDVIDCLNTAQSMGVRVFAFSNGSSKAVETLLEHAGIRHFFEGVVSVEGIQTFKPNPEVYHYFTQTTSSLAKDCWLISSNPFDVLGALNTQWQAAWVQRNKQVQFDAWDINPTVTIDGLSSLYQALREVN